MRSEKKNVKICNCLKTVGVCNYFVQQLLIIANKSINATKFYTLRRNLSDQYFFKTISTQDAPNAMTLAEVTKLLGVGGLTGRRWYIQATCAVENAGVNEGFDWLTSQFKAFL